MSCHLSCPSQHHSAASVANNSSGLLCSSLLPVISDFIPCNPQQPLLEVLFSTKVLCNEVLQEGLCEAADSEGLRGGLANERNNPVPKKDLGDFSSLAILSTLPGEQTSSLWERRQQLLLLRALSKVHSPLQVTKEQVNRFLYYSPPGVAESGDSGFLPPDTA